MYGPQSEFVLADYASSFRSHFIATILALAIIMSGIYKYLRSQSQDHYQAISEELDRASCTDSLTGVSNRWDMQDQRAAEFGRHKRHHHEFSVIMADLDHFKVFNDRYGHDVGDGPLVAVSVTLKAEVRRQDVVSRCDGEKFLILLPHTEPEATMRVAEKRRQAPSEPTPAETGADELYRPVLAWVWV